jgi:phosphate transport system substrate-binding protein
MYLAIEKGRISLMNNFKKLTVFVAICLFGVVFSVSAEELTIVGTGSGTAILKAIGAAFTLQHPGVTITVPKSIGSGGGIKAVGRDEYLLGRVAREINENEKDYGLSLVPVAKIPIVFFVNKSVTVGNLSVQQVLDIYSGKITNWKDVGGNDARIRVITREEGDSSLSVLEESFPGFKDITITSKSKMTFSDPETEAAVEEYVGAIAFGTYANAKNTNAKILTVDRKSATDSDYPYVGMLGLIFKEENYTGNIKMFVEFATSETAHEAIRESGGTPF